MEARLLEANSKLEKMIVLLGGEIFQEKGESSIQYMKCLWLMPGL